MEVEVEEGDVVLIESRCGAWYVEPFEIIELTDGVDWWSDGPEMIVRPLDPGFNLHGTPEHFEVFDDGTAKVLQVHVKRRFTPLELLAYSEHAEETRLWHRARIG